MTDLGDLAKHVLDQAGDGEQLEVMVQRQSDTEVRARDGDVESFTAADSLGVGVRIVAHHRQGFAYTGSFDIAAIDQAVNDARDNASFGTEDEYLGLAEPDGVDYPELDLLSPGYTATTTDRKIELALALEAAVRAADERVVGVDTLEYADARAEWIVANTHGIWAESVESVAYAMAWIIVSQGDETHEGYAAEVGRCAADLDIDKCATDATTRGLRMFGATKPKSSRVTIVLEQSPSADFVSLIGSTLSGESVLKKRSPFVDRLGDSIAAPQVQLLDDPSDPEAFTASQTDGEGLATRPNFLIEDGVLSRFVYDTYNARRAATVSTGSAVRGGYRSTPVAGTQALSLRPGSASIEELIGSVDHGVLVAELQGLHSGVNPISGDFSTGVTGIAIRDGALAEPIREATIASTLQRMLLDVSAIGAEVERLPGGATGVPLVIEDITLSGS
ncbi:MAG: TldD/PmbA family protein [Acidobacteria bacterium]|nr:TldD/PmbA family protein [Acidobacteriota bacterium]